MGYFFRNIHSNIYICISVYTKRRMKKKKKKILDIVKACFLNELVKLTQAQESPLSQMKSAEGWKLIFHLFY